ncbi:hypothetical protein AURDEDRAFT_182358 [Auricularia subglabra TFB-10046 SS5]|nr:hypothetical protein AURDEDRAFT_182358 [Auricularia subglabra TFB-10046 SS5]
MDNGADGVLVAIDDELSARVYRHEIPMTLSDGEPLRCVTYVSDGLAAHGQKEVVWSVRDYGGPVPQEPMRWFAMMLSYAKDGRTVDAFGVTEFSAQDWFGRDDLAAVVYMPAQVVVGLPSERSLPEPRLHAVALTAAERRAGLLRVLSMLGFASRYFPFPPWLDPKRPPVATEEQFAQSVLAHAGGGVRLPGVSATRRQTPQGPEVLLRIRPGATDAVRAAVDAYPPDAVLAMQMMELHEDADSCMVWTPGHAGLQAIGSGSTMNALGICFVAFCPNEPRFELRQLEDGYTVLITDEQWERVRQALTRREDLFLPADPAAPGTALRIEWVHETLPSAAHEREVTLNLSDFPQPPHAHVFLESVTLQDLDSAPTAGHVLSVLTFLRDALEALRAAIPPTPPTAVKPSADVPQDVSDDDEDDTDRDAQDDSEERWVLATLDSDDGGGALRVANVVMSPSDGVDISPTLKKMLRSVEMPHGTPRCKFQVVLRLWRPRVETG